MTDKIVQSNKLNDDIITSLVMNGDISKLTQGQKTQYYKMYCERLGLDPLTQPFKILKLQGKETLYCDRSGTQQLSKLHKVSHEIKSREIISDLYVVCAKASASDRSTESIGAVNITNLKGDALANAMMKAETKAKRRATLDLLGLGILDETEIETIPNAQSVEVETVIERNYTQEAKDCKTIDELGIWWKSLTPNEKKDLANLKEDRKAELTKANDKDLILMQINALTIESYIRDHKSIEKQIDDSPTAKRQTYATAYNKKLKELGKEEFQTIPF